MAPAHKITKSQGTPDRNLTTEDMLFLWTYMREFELPAGLHQSVASTWGVTKSSVTQRFHRLKNTLEAKLAARQRSEQEETEGEEGEEGEERKTAETTA